MLVNLIPGDIILTEIQGQGWISKAVKIGAMMRYGRKSKFVKYSHVALVIDDDGYLIEALSDGVRLTHISKYNGLFYVHIPTGAFMSQEDREQVVNFAKSVLDARTKYGWLTIVCLGIYCLTGGNFVFQRAGTAICSGLVCDALTRSDWIWPRPPFAMMPADIAAVLSEANSMFRELIHNKPLYAKLAA
jgi:hypothetical protein